ncbi:hypothetical protein P8C59_007314 [Phyllachora maydis]|uniref:DNA replication regulator Sld3 C-terminal domain-containing protein n=1 Tax=Phyllachora maydis TaxID=1825666 RepID=A0AAD9I9A3_9PEZI|nr:hypothetical protein P8C59_007314 [Phyllachora maydis]
MKKLPGAELPSTSRDQDSGQSTRKRNKHNLPVLLDVHADRLCIWQSTTLDDVKALAESQLASQDQLTRKADGASSDNLQDFCVDVILPFFSARLPELCDSINRKLGGPTMKSPAPARLSKPVAPPKSRPGAPARKSASSRRDKEKTLERVLSDERLRRSVLRGPVDAFALMSASFACSKDCKADKKALVEAELKDAISALKRPNRALAGKEIVEDAERRLITGVSQLKRLKKGGRVSSVPSVQVKATPVNNRFKDVIAAENQLPRVQQEVVRDEYRPSSSSIVPSSTAARKLVNIFSSGAPVRPSGDSVEEPLGVAGGNKVPTSSPGIDSMLFETPLKPRSSKATIKDNQMAQKAILGPLENKRDIYQDLGWDGHDDIDDLA